MRDWPQWLNLLWASCALRACWRAILTLRDLEQRITAAGLDTSDELAHLKESLGRSKDQQEQTTLTASLKRNEEQCNLLRGKGGVTAAVALDAHASLLIALDRYTLNVDPQKVLALAVEAEGLAPSVKTSSTLSAAHLFLAGKDLCQKDPSFASWYAKYRRSLGESYLMVVAASEPGPFQKQVLDHPDMKAAQQIADASWSVFPQGGSAFNWAMLRNADPAKAQRVAEAIRTTPHDLLAQTLEYLLAPTRPPTAMEMYWMQLIQNDPAKARQALSAVIAADIPLPFKP